MKKYDLDWLEQLNFIIESNISDPDFQLSDITTQINVSRAKLYRDLKRLTGTGANVYIKKKRLALAKELLEKRSYKTVNETALAVGFRKADYFSKLFREEFNVLPGAYLER